jgi:predicted nucleic acid-binding Zn ribbon protein
VTTENWIARLWSSEASRQARILMLESRKMKRAGEILAPLMRRLMARDAPLPWLEGSWKSIVGSRLAAHTRPVKLSNGVLEISADSLEWKNQLKDMVDEFPRRINAAWSGRLVEKALIILDARLEADAEAERNPFVRLRGVAFPRRRGGSPPR